MPKQNFEIRNFNFGIVAHPDDSRDIPDNAATDSLNIEPLTRGVLKGVPTDLILKGGGFEAEGQLSAITYTQGGTSGGTQQDNS